MTILRLLGKSGLAVLDRPNGSVVSSVFKRFDHVIGVGQVDGFGFVPVIPFLLVFCGVGDVVVVPVAFIPFKMVPAFAEDSAAFDQFVSLVAVGAFEEIHDLARSPICPGSVIVERVAQDALCFLSGCLSTLVRYGFSQTLVSRFLAFLFVLLDLPFCFLDQFDRAVSTNRLSIPLVLPTSTIGRGSHASNPSANGENRAR